ncbi:glycosyltransferase [Rhizobium sp. S163]|uniref:glycosyltransferase n=1 Tax=Rhizobium sp. S163 TaxID=3055039 RepID=UPI0025A97E11|nr:glycosyltransferase [Rhizobium sp. S163]MDM9649118.1 glycosyltransferase [Rhizobium sp. S163]
MNDSLGHARRRLVVISDYQEGCFQDVALPSAADFQAIWEALGIRGKGFEAEPSEKFDVEGSYIERLPLAFLRSGLVDSAEIWTHSRDPKPSLATRGSGPLRRRSFRMNGPMAPFASNDMVGYIAAFGAPDFLCVWGLGVDEEIMRACSESFKIYNSIDAPALRIPPEVSRHFDLVLTGADWQSEEVQRVHPGMATLVLPIGPEFASETMFRPLDLEKVYDVIYVAAAQPYKRHDLLFEALAKVPMPLKALCVCGYGELVDAFRAQTSELGLDVEFIGPPGVGYDDVNRYMNQSRIGVVCGVDDGAPAILTEYMLAGIPVLANSKLACGLQYITRETGLAVDGALFSQGIVEMLSRVSDFSPRQTVCENWLWPSSIEKLAHAIKSNPRGHLIFGSKEPSS